MTITSPDRELITEYAAKGSESAFRALVSRHVGLVYATALRQLGDPGLAEETTQNVFVALARKSPRLIGMETIAGWLHRSAILESKARLRAEIRRRRREEIAADLSVLIPEEDSPLHALVPMVDEALLGLRESDRLALVLRFFEERSLAEIGQVFGIEEDAARKRVSRALDKVTDFFRRRGLASSSSTGAILLTKASTAAPAGLAASAATAGLASGGIGGIGVVMVQIMSLTKIQTALICAALVAAPLTYQWKAEARLAQQQKEAQFKLTEAQAQAGQLQSDLERSRQASARAQSEALNAQAQLQALTNRLASRAPLTRYRWDDNSPLARIPKQMLKGLRTFPVKDNRGELSDPIKEVLQLSDAESRQVQDALDHFLKECHAAQAQSLRPAEPLEAESNGHPRDEIRAFAISKIGDQFNGLRDDLINQLNSAIGPDRSELLKESLENYIPLDSDGKSISSAMAFFNSDHRQAFYKPKPGSNWIGWGVFTDNSAMLTVIRPDCIPDYLRAQIQDWIAIAQNPANGGQP